MRTLRATALLAVLSCVAPLASAGLPAQAEAAAADELAQRVDALREEFEAASRAFRQDLRAIEDRAERARVQATSFPGREYFDRAQALASEAPERDEPVALLVAIAGDTPPGPQREELFAALAKSYADRRPLDRAAHEARREPWARGFLETLLAKNEHPHVRAAASLALAQELFDAEDEASRAKARELLETLRDEYAEIELRQGTSYAAAAEPFLFELDHLQIGMVAPDIEGEDIAGTPFKLSDYRGKVVFLDFWGNW